MNLQNRELLYAAAQTGDLPKVTRLAGLVDVCHDNDYVFRVAAEFGHIHILRYLLENFPTINPAAMDNYAVRWAANYGFLDVVKYLCSLKQVNPADGNNTALEWAAENGNVAVVEFLCEQPMVMRTLTLAKANQCKLLAARSIL